ncbi:MAG: pentapeptide repeat-containing protein, partial [Actinomycetota bacterium]
MAGSRRADDDLRRFWRRLHLTPNGPELAELAVAGGVSLVLLGVSWFVGLPWWSVPMAAFPVVSQVRSGVLVARRRRRDEDRTAPTVGLAGADLAGAELPLADLRAKDLASATLLEANLVGADLARTDLLGARLGRADLRYGSLEDAQCCDASFVRARLTEADLSGVDARGANFEGADLRLASLAGADLRRVRFAGADVRGADFTGARLAADALADAVVDDSTIRHDGRRSIAEAVSGSDRWRSELALVVRRRTLGIAGPAVVGLAWSAGLGATALMIEASGGGLGDDLTEMASSDPMAEVSSSERGGGLRDLFGGAGTGGGVGRASSATGSSSADRAGSTIPPTVDPAETAAGDDADDGDAATGGTAGADGSTPGAAAGGQGSSANSDAARGGTGDGTSSGADGPGLVGFDPVPGAAQEVTTGAGSGVGVATTTVPEGDGESGSGDEADRGSPSTTAAAPTTGEPADDGPTEPGGPPALGEVTPPTVAAQATLRRVR